MKDYVCIAEDGNTYWQHTYVRINLNGKNDTRICQHCKNRQKRIPMTDKDWIISWRNCDENA